jgi:hypothetical protein
VETGEPPLLLSEIWISRWLVKKRLLVVDRWLIVGTWTVERRRIRI